MNRLQKCARGFTLIELTIAVAVIAVLASIAVPSYSTFIEKRKIAGGAEEIAAFMMLARSEAVKRNQQTTVSFSRDSNTDWCIGMSLGEVACDCTEAVVGNPSYCALKYTDSGGASVVETQLISSGDYSGFNLTVATTGSGDASLTYDPIRGILDDVADTPSFTIQSNNTAYELTVNVSPTGMAKTCTNSNKVVTGFKLCS